MEELNKVKRKAFLLFLGSAYFIFMSVLLILALLIKKTENILGSILLLVVISIIAIILYLFGNDYYVEYKELLHLKEKDIVSFENKIKQMKEDEQKEKSEQQELVVKRIKERAAEENEIRNKVNRLKAEGKVCCPRCGSESVSAGTRGFTITTGFVGSGNVRCVCLNCGYKWKPKR